MTDRALASDPPAAGADPGATPPQPTMRIDAEMAIPALRARIVRFDIPRAHHARVEASARYLVNFCLTPRPLQARAGYVEHWGPLRYERLGDIFVVPPGEVLQFRGESGSQATLLCELDPDLVTRMVGQALSWSDQELTATLDVGNAQLRALLLRMAGELRHPGYAADRMLELMAGELAIEIGRACLETHERPSTGGLASWRLRLIDERIAGNPAAPTLADLAARCNLSVRQLTRGFRVSRGCSIGDYIEQRRMETAKRLLVGGESVKAVAFAMGFASPSSFTFAFRRAAGMSPNQFRSRQPRGGLAS